MKGDSWFLGGFWHCKAYFQSVKLDFGQGAIGHFFDLIITNRISSPCYDLSLVTSFYACMVICRVGT
jgi:hypothetical protein